MTVTNVLQAGFYIMGCPDVLRSVAGCGKPPVSKVGQLVQQCYAGLILGPAEGYGSFCLNKNKKNMLFFYVFGVLLTT